MREVNEPLTSLVKSIDQKVTEASPKYPGGRKLGTFLIIGDSAGRADQLRSLAQKEGLQRVSLCIGAAPPRYEISPDVDVTVVIYTPGRPGRQEVKANFALRTNELDATRREAIVAALANVLPK